MNAAAQQWNAGMPPFRAPLSATVLLRRTLAGVALLIGTLGLAGSTFAPSFLATWGAWPVQMTPLGGVWVCLLASSVFLATDLPKLASGIGALCAGMAGASLALTLTVRGNSGMEWLTIPADTTRACVVLLGLALVVRSNAPASQWLCVGSLVTSLAAALSFVFQLDLVQASGRFGSMALSTAVALLCLSVSILIFEPDAGLMSAFMRPGPAQILAQRFLPLAALAFIFVHWLGRTGYQLGLYTPGFSSVMVTVTGIFVIAVLTWRAIRQIQQAELARNHAMELFEAAASATNSLIYEWELASGRVRRIRGLHDLTGFEDHEAEPNTTWWLSLMHPEDRRRLYAVPQQLQVGVVYRSQYRVRTKSGEYRDVLDSFIVQPDRTGQPGRVVGSTVDVTEQRRSEERLRASNEDLRSFAYAAAHDLQEPLRMVTVFTQMLGRSLPADMPPQARDWMRYIEEGAKRLHDLLDDLRTYTELSQDNGEESRTDANAALGKALENLALTIRESQAEVHAESLPVVVCREVGLVQVFQNLISNAIKYRSEEKPLIRIWSERTAEGWMIAVKDNGIGIDPRYAQQIFGVFKRLSRQTEGTGIGLAICARVVEQAGGRIWVESELGKGATFKFVLRG